ncbi:hypothetical protein EYC80_004261 [Monilinia laxa]|uniref:Uncharacterized protein n=1 Tax=Monilinia laxa TaxID=61186 RepID=A0A5N6KM79_MONLA|nr:hypothetical protein EYC80_004261 [Monilinia laxa]
MTIPNKTILIALVSTSKRLSQYKRQTRTRQDPNLVACLRLRIRKSNLTTHRNVERATRAGQLKSPPVPFFQRPHVSAQELAPLVHSGEIVGIDTPPSAVVPIERAAPPKGSTARAHKAFQSISTACKWAAEILTDCSSEPTAETASTRSPDPDSPDCVLNCRAPLSAPEAAKSEHSKILRMTASTTTSGVTSEKFGTQDGRPGCSEPNFGPIMQR